jgi:membrane-associated protease RseP (regulator of RpoE activity)
MRDLIDSIAQKSPRFWKVIMNIGIPVAVFFMVLIFYLLIQSLDSTITTMLTTPTKTVQSGVGIVIPGVDVPGSPITPPLGYGLVALVTVLVVHEFAHGILARAEGIKIKSIGVLLLAILPGAFVEPDEKEVKKASRLTKLRIYAAGSIFNIGFAGIAFALALLLSAFFIGPSFDSNGLEIVKVMPDTPADGVFKQGMIITNINGHDIKNKTTFSDLLNKTKPGDILTIKTNKGTFEIKTINNPNNESAYIGISSKENLLVKGDVSSKYGDTLPWILFGFVELLGWIFILNFGIGTFNLLPLKPLDGGLMLEELLNYRIHEDTSNKITNIVSVISLVLVVSAIGLSLIPALSKIVNF